MNPSYYAIIPADVRYSEINPSAKLLYGEITALCNQKGYCWATNSYFSNLYGVTKNTISTWVSELKKNNFVTVEVIRNDKKQVIQRKIGIIENRDTPIIEILKGNSKENNTKKDTINTDILEFRLMKFGSEVSDISAEIQMDISEANKFIDYWTEPNKSGTRMRFEMQTTWDTNRRLLRWQKNNLGWTGSIQKTKVSKYPTKVESAHKEWLKARNSINNEI